MSLRLILGRAGSGKTRLCLREITERLQAEPEGPPLIYIVPEQGAFQAEYALATTPGLGGIIRAQVLSFRRLAWKVMQESGGGQHLYIDDTGKGMLLRKVLEKKKRQLKVFKNAGELQGALENIVSIYNELKRSRTASGELEKVLEMLGEGEGPALLREKIGDLLLLFQDMDAILKGRYFDAEDYLSALAEKAFTSEFLSAAEVWVDGFYGFTNQEYAVLGALMKRCLRLSVTLCIEQEYVPGVGVDELDPFHPAAVSCQRLMKEAEEQEVEVEDSVVLTGERFSAEVHPALAFLEKNLYNYSLKAGDKKDDGSKEQRLPLRLVAAANRREEVEALACELIRLARDEGYRWREFAVIVGDLEHYRDIIATVFNDYGIPFFLDQKRQVLQHPLVEFIRSALEVVNGYWRYEALFRCIKTGFLLPFAAALEQRQRWEERVFLLENYVLAFGIQGSRWLQEEMWCYRLSDSLEGEEREITKDEEEYLQMIDETRRVISRPLLGFQERVKKAQTVKEKTEALYTLLLDIQAAERLEYWSEEAVKRGEPEKAREHLQVYKGLIELMDQLVEILGEEKLSLPIYTRILESGLESMRLSLVPPSLDQVLVGNVERTRTGRVKYAFLLGVNDGILPARPPEDRLFSEEERELLAEQGVEMAPGSKRRLLDEQFLLYMALTRASHGLWISYPLADEEGGALMPSLLIKRLQELFPALNVETAENLSGPSTIVHPRQALSQLAVRLSEAKNGEQLPSFWWDLYNWFAVRKEWAGQGKRLLAGLFYKNSPAPLTEETTRRLYGRKIRASVSRMERFSACPFAQFLSYGLRLQKRRVYKLELFDIGRFFHAALHNLTVSLLEEGRQWGELTREECYRLAEDETARLVPRLQEEILLSSQRYRYLAKKLRDTLSRAAVFLAEQDRKSRFKPLGTELSFGADGELPPVVFTLRNGSQVELVGRIDRVDLARGEGGKAYLRVIDYKSGRTDLSLEEIYYGLSLQMLTYLDVLLVHAREWLGEEVLPGGVLYFRVHSPFIRADGLLPAEKVEREHRKQYRMRGVILADEEVARLMDTGLLQGYSEIIPVALDKNGKFYSNAPVWDAERFSLLRCHTRRVIKECAEAIMSGQVVIAPYRLKGEKACTYCDFKPVCQFDPLLEGNKFRNLQAESGERIWTALRQELRYSQPADNERLEQLEEKEGER